MENWKEVYPYTLDKPLKWAMKLAFENKDEVMAKKIQDIFLSYRKSKYTKEHRELEQLAKSFRDTIRCLI